MSLQVIVYLVLVTVFTGLFIYSGLNRIAGKNEKFNKNLETIFKAAPEDEIDGDGYWKFYGWSTLIFGLLCLVVLVLSYIFVDLRTPSALGFELLQLFLILIVGGFYIRFYILRRHKEVFIKRVNSQRQMNFSPGVIVLGIALLYSFIMNIINIISNY